MPETVSEGGAKKCAGQIFVPEERFSKKLGEIFTFNEIDHVFLNNDESSPLIAIAFTDYDPYPLYKFLNDQQVHTKCIKNHPVNQINYHILRIGIPYYETMERLNYVLFEIWRYINENVPIEKSANI